MSFREVYTVNPNLIWAIHFEILRGQNKLLCRQEISSKMVISANNGNMSKGIPKICLSSKIIKLIKSHEPSYA